jgi:hypothetical protein
MVSVWRLLWRARNFGPTSRGVRRSYSTNPGGATKVLQCRSGLHQKNSPSRKSICPIETGGEFLPDGRSISPVRDSNTDRLKILIAGKTNDVTDSIVDYAGRTYVPPDLSELFQSAIVFPEESRDFGSTGALFTGIKESIMDFGLPEQAVLIDVYFLLSSWLVEILPAAPFLLISGRRAQASLLLALLSCLVRHPLPLVEISAARLRSLPVSLHPTLLIDDELMPDPLFRLLSVSNNRNANIASKDGVVDAYGAKALYCGLLERDDSFGDAAMHINLSPSGGIAPILSKKDRQDLAAKFQPESLAYRVRNIARVAAVQFEYAGVSTEVRRLAGVLAGCIVDAPALQEGVGPLFEAQQDRFRGDRWVEPRCVVIEAILSRCHRQEQ